MVKVCKSILLQHSFFCVILFFCVSAKSMQNESIPMLGLIESSKKGNFQGVKTLLDRHADPNLGDASAIKPLEHAVRGGHVEVVALLLSARANVDATIGAANTVYGERCRQVVQLLIAASDQEKQEYYLAGLPFPRDRQCQRKKFEEIRSVLFKPAGPQAASSGASSASSVTLPSHEEAPKETQSASQR